MTEAVATYAADTDRWEAWQREYRLGVLLIYAPGAPDADL
jgi:hypothetical protein